MSEKRFKSTLDEDTMSIMPYLVSDNEEEIFYNLEDCVDLLNFQNTQIKCLKEKNEQLKEAKYEYKQDWKQASVNCDLYKQEISFLKEEIKGFEEENEQLRKELDNFKPIIFKNMQKGTIILYSKGDVDE